MAVECPKCGGEMWNNIQKKAEGKFKATSPDYSCKDKSCGGAIWPPKDGPKRSMYDELKEQDKIEEKFAKTVTMGEKVAEYASNYETCLSGALALKSAFADRFEIDAQALATTFFIEYNKNAARR